MGCGGVACVPMSRNEAVEVSVSDLVCRNIRIAGRRTSIKLEEHMWDALAEICQRTGKTVHQVCTEIHDNGEHSNFTSRVRVFILGYFRGAERRARNQGARSRKPSRDASDASGLGEFVA